jgi:hypothetical protein
MAAIVVQLGLAMMPLGRLASACPFTSATTSGTSGSIRHADELSITTGPAAATCGASSFEVAPPAENKAMSRPDHSAAAASSTTTSVPFHGRVRPAERAEANSRSSLTGKSRSSRMARITPPT